MSNNTSKKLLRALSHSKPVRPARTRLVAALGHLKAKPNQETSRLSMRLSGPNAVRLRAGGRKTFREFTGSAYNGGVMYPAITIGDVTETMPIVLDLDTLIIPKPDRPVLDDHDESPDGVIGATTMIAVRKRDYTLPVTGIIYTKKARSQKYLDAADGGHRWQLSVGTDNFTLERIEPGQTVRVNNRTFSGPVNIARNAYLTDLSFTAIGGDDTTHATIAARRAQLLSVGGAHPNRKGFPR